LHCGWPLPEANPLPLQACPLSEAATVSEFIQSFFGISAGTHPCCDDAEALIRIIGGEPPPKIIQHER